MSEYIITVRKNTKDRIKPLLYQETIDSDCVENALIKAGRTYSEFNNKDINLLKKVLNVQTISTPFFKHMLYYDPDTKQYSTEGNVLSRRDKRLIKYLKNLKNLIPVDLF